jgi:hypothetical protein
MARTPLKDIILSERIVQSAVSGGNAIVVQNSQAATATVYSAATGTGTLTNSFSFSTYPALQTSGLPGFIEPGSYQFSCGGAIVQAFDTSATDGTSPGIPSDDLTSVYNVAPQETIPSVSATTTSQTVKFVRIVPDKPITAATVIVVSGTAVA